MTFHTIALLEQIKILLSHLPCLSWLRSAPIYRATREIWLEVTDLDPNPANRWSRSLVESHSSVQGLCGDRVRWKW